VIRSGILASVVIKTATAPIIESQEAHWHILRGCHTAGGVDVEVRMDFSESVPPDDGAMGVAQTDICTVSGFEKGAIFCLFFYMVVVVSLEAMWYKNHSRFTSIMYQNSYGGIGERTKGAEPEGSCYK
jgi:hypothetical protein